MHTLRIVVGLLVVSIGLAGCSSTSGVRTGNSSKIKTVASIGDKPLPVVTGEPGSTVAADEYTPERPVRTAGRISGHVLDDRGDPVANARVNVAVSKALREASSSARRPTARGRSPSTASDPAHPIR